MIHDNEYCLKIAKWLVERHGDDKEQLIHAISGELNRLHRRGQSDSLDIIQDALRKADTIRPR